MEQKGRGEKGNDGSDQSKWDIGSVYKDILKIKQRGIEPKEEFDPESDENEGYLVLKHLNNKQRGEIHSICDYLHLAHNSVEDPASKAKFLVISVLPKPTSRNEYDPTVLKKDRWKNQPVKAKTKTQSKQKKFDRIPTGISCITPNELYLGSGRDAYDLEQLEHNKIKYIINVAHGEWRNEFEFLGDRFVYLGLQLKDESSKSNDFTKFLGQIVEFIEEVEKKKLVMQENERDDHRIFVHCVIGKSRSAAMVVGWLMKRNKWTAKQALEHVQEKRNNVLPNIGFMRALLVWEKEIMGEESCSCSKLWNMCRRRGIMCCQILVLCGLCWFGKRR
eukprot:TRINITY_DN5186_c0_g1_i1.p1 TRINITY_DN5186_c0_g1~~TRINITY_DN5186_c0_g1_i1.p1  ORF type:complete len:333 (-),score=70.47 TRINITY_DN5186_c0_g1_i1:47-1045(-)